MTHLMLRAFLATLMVVLPYVTSQELVISALADLGNYGSLVELTACSPILDLSVYELQQLDEDPQTVDEVELSAFNNIPAGSRIYVVTDCGGCSFFQDFFFGGSTPGYFIASVNIFFDGDDDAIVLSYDDIYSEAIIDLYNSTYEGSPLDFTLGWAQRKSGTGPSAYVNINDWVVQQNAFGNNPGVDPLTNSDAPFPLQLGTYQCPTPEPSQSPTQPPTLRPTLGGRLHKEDATKDKIRPPVVPTPVVASARVPPTPAPVLPVSAPVRNPRRKRPSVR